MTGCLVAKEGPLFGLVIRFQHGDEWVIGRDPDDCFQIIEDPMVSRRHLICYLSEEGYLLENISSVNPALVNGKPLSEPTLLKEGDLVQIGSALFYFTQQPMQEVSAEPAESEEEYDSPTIYEEDEEFKPMIFDPLGDSHWTVKIVGGPNTGAEFHLEQDHTYILGKDGLNCDIIFQDLSVSKQHLRLTTQGDRDVIIEDLGSRNGTFVNHQQLTESVHLKSQDLIQLGTTSFIFIDNRVDRETVVSLNAVPTFEQSHLNAAHQEEPTKANWKKMVIPIRHLVIAGMLALMLLVGVGSAFTLFTSKPVPTVLRDETNILREELRRFPEVEFSFNQGSHSLFLVGHVMTEINHQELAYIIRSFPFVQVVEDNVIIDELVWENTNALMAKNIEWRGVNLTSIVPGHFILRGYVDQAADAAKLSEYINLNFPYIDRFENRVVVVETLKVHVQSLLDESQLSQIEFQFVNGELILSGQVGTDQQPILKRILQQIEQINGVHHVKNFAVLVAPINRIIDLTSQYSITGSSKHGNHNQYVVINGKILSTGDLLNGMTITTIEPDAILLEKDGIKYQISYNRQ